MISSQLNAVIGGSYRKHLDLLFQIKTFLQEKRITVLSPVGSTALNPTEEFLILDDDPIHDPRILQDSIFAKMRMSSFYVLANEGGYIGNAAAIEIGYAISLGIQVLVLHSVVDPNIAPYVRSLYDVFPDAREYLGETQDPVNGLTRASKAQRFASNSRKTK